jgi:hypothetical protein
MARQKRNSKLTENAQRRLESMRSINPDLDFDNQVSLYAFSESIEQVRQAIAHYNTLLSMVDEAQKVVESAEERVSELSTRLLQNVGARYGKQSVEYMKAGGKSPQSKRKSGTGNLSSGATTLSTVLLTAPTAQATNGAARNGKAKV